MCHSYILLCIVLLYKPLSCISHLNHLSLNHRRDKFFLCLGIYLSDSHSIGVWGSVEIFLSFMSHFQFLWKSLQLLTRSIHWSLWYLCFTVWALGLFKLCRYCFISCLIICSLWIRLRCFIFIECIIFSSISVMSLVESSSCYGVCYLYAVC